MSKSKETLQQEIEELFLTVGVGFDSLDLGCTLYVAMTEGQRNDLEAMLHYLEGSGMEQESVAYNIWHDLNGLKAVHFNLPEGDCFLPRSAGYLKKVS